MGKKKNTGINLDDFSPLQLALLKAAASGRSPAKQKGKISVSFADPHHFVGAKIKDPLTKDEVKTYEDSIAERDPLVKSVLNVLNGPGDSIERLAFEVSPYTQNMYGGLWKRKLRLLPDEILKRLAIQDDLVAAIVNT